MEVKSTIIFVLLMVVACNGCEMHRRQERARQKALRQAEELRRAYDRRALRQAQEEAYEDVRQSVYSPGSHSSQVYTGNYRQPVTRTSYLPEDSKFCPGSRRYYCNKNATCIPGVGGIWKCQYREVTSYRPTVSRSRYPVSSPYRTRQRYYPYQPSNYGNVQRTYTTYKCGPGRERVNITERTFKCVDIDECGTDANQCEQTCVNTDGSYYCRCTTGYERSGTTDCVDKDECELFANGRGFCSPASVCVNTEGSYECICNDGYRDLGNRICREIDECEEDNPCEDTEICFNTYGGYECNEPIPCPEGYSRSNLTRDLNSDCIRTALESEEPKYITYKKIKTDVDHRRGKIASFTFRGGNIDYNHYFSVQVLEGRENFWYRNPSYGSRQTLSLDIYSRNSLEAGVILPYTLLITDRMTPTAATYRRYRYRGGEYGQYYQSGPKTITTKRKLVIEVVPMSHEATEVSDY